jgi:5-methylcytosine-specific restriction endonuclease McrA
MPRLKDLSTRSLDAECKETVQRFFRDHHGRKWPIPAPTLKLRPNEIKSHFWLKAYVMHRDGYSCRACGGVSVNKDAKSYDNVENFVHKFSQYDTPDGIPHFIRRLVPSKLQVKMNQRSLKKECDEIGNYFDRIDAQMKHVDEAFLAADEGRAENGNKYEELQLCVVHKKPVKEGGDNSPGNLFVLCERCFKSKLHVKPEQASRWTRKQTAALLCTV